MPLDLRKLAEAQPCYYRLYPFCRYQPEYTVLSHLRIGLTGGTGLKPPDICGVPGCDACHDVIDGRTKQDVYTPTQLLAERHRAQNQWLEWLWKREYIIPGGIAA